jgi:acetyltransferase-like isoleucine patch superfamily enzyme
MYLRLCRPTAGEYTEFLRLHGGFHSIGEHCNILPTTVFTDPAYVKMGSNVHFSDCAIIGHDGSIAMLNRAYGLRLDSVGKVDIRDNVFIGFGAIVLPGVTIGPNAIVAAGAVVNRDVRAGDIVGGVPARPIGRTEDLATKLAAKTETLPWNDLIKKRGLGFGQEMEGELVRQRVEYFYSGQEQDMAS